MIIYKQGNILDVTSGIIVHGCNMQGKMGGGVALQIKQKWPECYTVYKQQLLLKKLGETIWYPVNEKLWVVNALTQEFYGRDPYKCYLSYLALKDCLDYVINYAVRTDQNIHLPDMIGCGLAGGDRDLVIRILHVLTKKNNFMNDLTIWHL